MKKQKRYTTREQITNALEASHEQLAYLVKAAHAEDAAAKQNAKNAAATTNASDGAFWEAQSRHHVKERQKFFKSAERVETIKIPKLVRTLADFDTQPMAIAGLNDEAVVLSR